MRFHTLPPLPVDDGLRIEFQTHPLGSPLPSIAAKGRRFALAGFEIIPDEEVGKKSGFEQVLTRALGRKAVAVGSRPRR